jgi:pimeloyl-ACP methyl ester carboxylesterase
VVKRLVAGISVAAVLVLAASASAAPQFKRCGRYGFSCARVSVPIDHSHRVPGGISLAVERLPARRQPARGATFLIAGGPGESATDAFGGDALSTLSPARETNDLIVFDQRGTGHSGLLRCSALERANLLHATGAAAGCATRLGANRSLYTTRDSVEDIETLRQALGYQRIALYGVSYGTKVALAYALAHPDRVERLALDSVVAPDGPDPLYRDTFKAVPRELRSLCRTGCRSFTRDAVGDLRRLVGRLARRPLRGRVVDAGGRVRRATLSRADLLLVLLAGDFDPGLRAAFPSAVQAGLRGDPAPLLRLRRRALAIDALPPPARELSAAAYAATTCEESTLPWPRTAPYGARRALARAAVDALPASAFDPFDRLTALDSDVLALCVGWPAAPAAPALARGPLPDVPVLTLEGEDDLRTPVESARPVVARFRQGHLLVVPNTGHSVLGSDVTGCAERAFRRFFEGGSVPASCPRGRRLVRPPPPPPRSLRSVSRLRHVRGLRGRALHAVALTLGDVATDTLSSLILDPRDPDLARGGGLRAGSYRLTGRQTLVLRRLSFVPGLRVTGRLRNFLGRRQRGRLHISGPATPDGVIRIRGERVSGRLGGRRVRARLPLDASIARASLARARTSAVPGARAAAP